MNRSPAVGSDIPRAASIQLLHLPLGWLDRRAGHHRVEMAPYLAAPDPDAAGRVRQAEGLRNGGDEWNRRQIAGEGLFDRVEAIEINDAGEMTRRHPGRQPRKIELSIAKGMLVLGGQENGVGSNIGGSPVYERDGLPHRFDQRRAKTSLWVDRERQYLGVHRSAAQCLIEQQADAQGGIAAGAGAHQFDPVYAVVGNIGEKDVYYLGFMLQIPGGLLLGEPHGMGILILPKLDTFQPRGERQVGRAEGAVAVTVETDNEVCRGGRPRDT